jgi:hypothetical protein
MSKVPASENPLNETLKLAVSAGSTASHACQVVKVGPAGNADVPRPMSIGNAAAAADRVDDRGGQLLDETDVPGIAVESTARSNSDAEMVLGSSKRWSTLSVLRGPSKNTDSQRVQGIDRGL